MKKSEVIVQLREAHRAYVRACGVRFWDVPFRARSFPGWIYDPRADRVVKEEDYE